jgi:hypothetical protein
LQKSGKAEISLEIMLRCSIADALKLHYRQARRFSGKCNLFLAKNVKL